MWAGPAQPAVLCLEMGTQSCCLQVLLVASLLFTVWPPVSQLLMLVSVMCRVHHCGLVCQWVPRELGLLSPGLSQQQLASQEVAA